jgi:hypothetical protein
MLSPMKKPKNKRHNEDSGLAQTSVWLNAADIQTLREIGKRSDVDREWSWLARKAIREYIERDATRAKSAATQDRPRDVFDDLDEKP